MKRTGAKAGNKLPKLTGDQLRINRRLTNDALTKGRDEYLAGFNNGRDGVVLQLSAIKIILQKEGHSKNALLVPLDALINALVALNRGEVNKLFLPSVKRAAGRPPGSRTEFLIQATSVAMVQTLSTMGWSRHSAYSEVAKILHSRRVTTSAGAVVKAKTVQGWYNNYQTNGRASADAKARYLQILATLTAFGIKHSGEANVDRLLIEAVGEMIQGIWIKADPTNI